MSKLIFTVIDYGWQAGDTLVIVSDRTSADVDFRNGDMVELRRPDNTTLQAKCNYVFTDPPSDPPAPIWYGLVGLTKDDVPVGTQGWLTASLPRPPLKTHRKFERRQTL